MSFTISNTGNVIKWSKSRKLQISDFVQVSDPLPNGATAITSTGIWMDRDNTRPCGWKAYAVFDKIGSKWYIHGQKRFSELILQHEQLHFDITNYMSNRLDSVLKSLPNRMSQYQLDSLYYDWRMRLDSMQKWYDKSVDHSRDSVSQSKWNRYVDSLLKK